MRAARGAAWLAAASLIVIGRWLTPTSAGAQATPAPLLIVDLDAVRARLGSDDPHQREGAHNALLELDEQALDAVAARVVALASRRPTADELTVALADIRRATGSRRADDRVDIESGVLPALAVRRDAAMISACESVLLWRALERIGSTRAYRLIADVVALDGSPWEQETQRLLERAGPRLGPMLIAVRNHPNATVRRWSRQGTASLGFDQPGRAVQQRAVAEDATLLSDTLRSWGAVHQLDAMRVIASYVGSEHGEVRDAARSALASYGRNAIWIVREQLALVSGTEVDPHWGSERALQALLDAHDEARLAPVRAELASGLAALTHGNLDAMGAHFGRVLLRAPELAHRDQMAIGYARLGAARREAHDLAGAERAYRRALLLGGSSPEAVPWRDALRGVQADSELARGVADVHLYRQIAARYPEDRFASEVLSRLSGERAAEERHRKRVAAAWAALSMFLAAVALLVGRRRPAARATPHTSAPTEDAASARFDDTSPGSLDAAA